MTFLQEKWILILVLVATTRGEFSACFTSRRYAGNRGGRLVRRQRLVLVVVVGVFVFPIQALARDEGFFRSVAHRFRSVQIGPPTGR
jgi:hypothetical protein